MNGFIHAVANQQHPFQTKVTLILTDFEPNRNKQGVPRAEAENILRTALYTPIKINYDGESYGGHVGAIPIGPIVAAYAANDNGSDVIAGEAIIWNDIYENIDEHLKQAFAEGVGTSWEIYFENSHKDDNGIQWLEECVFGGTCVVDKPAYGSNRTRFLAIAEQLENKSAEPNNEVTTDMADNKTATADDQTTVNDLRTDMSKVMDILSGLYNSLYEKMDQTYELESQLVTNDMTAMAEQLTKLVAGIDKRFNALTEKANASETELTQLKDQIATAEAEAEKQVKKETRSSELAQAGLTIADEDLQTYIDMDDKVFELFINGLKAVRVTKAEASDKEDTIIIPNPQNNSANNVPSIKEIAAVLRRGN